MEVIKKGKQEEYSDLYPDNYEFRLCGGAVVPEDRVQDAAQDAGSKDNQA